MRLASPPASVFAAFLGLHAAGCTAPGGGTKAAMPTASPRPYTADVPLVEGFKLVDRSSEEWAAGPVRYLRHRYSGRGDKRAVWEFYRRQMPLVRWTRLSDGMVDGRYTIQFVRGNEKCTVVIADETRGLARLVVVDVLITPMARTHDTDGIIGSPEPK